MKHFSVFDIVGPDMIGPSSSHTAGAARLAFMACRIFGEKVVKVRFILHGSFAKTYKGHGTDKALLAGIMGIKHNDARLRDAFELAKGVVDFEYVPSDLGDVHPNTVLIEMTGESGVTSSIQGSSIGGGNAVINKIDGVDVTVDGSYDTLITIHKDKPGMVNKLTQVFYDELINLAFMKLYREFKGDKAILVAELDEPISPQALQKLRELTDVYKMTYIPKGGR
jgi:L-serine dehydratase